MSKERDPKGSIKQINLKMSTETLDQLDKKASKMGLNRTSYIKLIAMMDVEFQLVGSPIQSVSK
ncbi:MAG: hypothetical protein NZ824_02960 [Candidatus Thioglobus sp.]|nr:hypothetical protein [Candidatus Thioglobus sp.]